MLTIVRDTEILGLIGLNLVLLHLITMHIFTSIMAHLIKIKQCHKYCNSTNKYDNINTLLDNIKLYHDLSMKL